MMEQRWVLKVLSLQKYFPRLNYAKRIIAYQIYLII